MTPGYARPTEESLILNRIHTENPSLLATLQSGRPVLVSDGMAFRVTRLSVLEGKSYRGVLLEGVVRSCVIVIYSEIDSPITEVSGWYDLSPESPWQWRTDIQRLARGALPAIGCLMKGLTVKDLVVAIKSLRTNFTGRPLYEYNMRRDFPIMVDVLAGRDNTFSLCTPRRW